MTQVGPRTGAFPRVIAPGVLWTGGATTSSSKELHTHFSAFIVRGTEKSVIVDTGHAFHGERLDRDLDDFLGGRPLDYIFPTHGEFPHMGLLVRWMDKYPKAKVIGPVGDLKLSFPGYADRFVIMKAGESIDLGDRHFLLVPAIWRDLRDTLWAFETKDRVLFASDGFAHLHPHAPNQCDALTSELPPPAMKHIQHFNRRALHWTGFINATQTYAALDEMLRVLAPRIIAEAHGNVIDNKEAMLPLFKEGMVTKQALSYLRGNKAST
jgi:flavorubredoxin